MKKTIFKGFHRPIQLPAFLSPMGFLVTDKYYTFSRKIKFHENCAYNLKTDKQYDWNKLFGVCLGIRGIHKNSIRFGWRYNIFKNSIELCTIVYKDGEKPQRTLIQDADLLLGGEATFTIKMHINPYGVLEYAFHLNNMLVSNGNLGVMGCLMYFGCGFYFGGESKAPHKISATYKKV